MESREEYRRGELDGSLPDLLEQYPSLRRCVGTSPAIRSVLFDLVGVATTNCPIQLEGESGTGKELVAQIVHEIATGLGEPFEALNCGAIPESLLESELFGHVAGAFTGATRSHRGVFERAAEGTVFLDEIAELSPSAQVKLLRVLQEGTFLPVGGEDLCYSRARVVTATNRDLAAEVRGGRFRQDLFYRLNVYPIRLPPLRERREDIPALVEAILEASTRDRARPRPRVHAQAMARLLAYTYPGNVRELQNIVSALLIEARGTEEIEPRHVASVFSRHRLESPGPDMSPPSSSPEDPLFG